MFGPDGAVCGGGRYVLFSIPEEEIDNIDEDSFPPAAPSSQGHQGKVIVPCNVQKLNGHFIGKGWKWSLLLPSGARQPTLSSVKRNVIGQQGRILAVICFDSRLYLGCVLESKRLSNLFLRL